MGREEFPTLGISVWKIHQNRWDAAWGNLLGSMSLLLRIWHPQPSVYDSTSQPDSFAL